MDEDNGKSPDNFELNGNIIQFLQQQYDLTINLTHGMLNFGQMELIKNDLTTLEKTPIGKILFMKISELMKQHPECKIILASQCSSGSSILTPVKDNDRIILKIGIDYELINNDQYIYLCKTEFDEFFFVMTHHLSPVVLGHELGHLLQTLLKFDDIFIGTDENEWESKWLKMSYNEYHKKILDICSLVAEEIKKKFPDFIFNNSSNLKFTIQNYTSNLINAISNKYPEIISLNSILTRLASSLNFNEYVNAIKGFKDEYQYLINQGESILYLSEIYYSFVFVLEVWNENNYEDLINILPHEIHKGCFLSDGELLKEVQNETKENICFYFF